MAARGIKTKIGLNVIVLLLLSALVTDVLVVTVVQGVMMRDVVSQSKKQIAAIGQLYFSNVLTQSAGFDPKKELATTLMMGQDRIGSIYIVDGNGVMQYRQSSSGYPYAKVEAHVEEANRRQQTIINELGYSWSIFWWHPKAISISVPVVRDTKTVGVISGVVPLTPIYSKLKKYHNPIFIYLLINTAVLTIVGLYRIFRHYLRPIDRIVQQADGFHEESDIFFAFRNEDSELNRLSSALNRMLTRISSDKKKLKATVASLEQANVELKNTQKEMIRAEKMASVGRLAAGIAHEIGNPIGIVLGYLDMIKQEGLDETDRIDFLKRTEDEVQRISTIIRQLLDLARPKERPNEHVQVKRVIGDIVEVMQSQPVMSDIQIEFRDDAQDDSIWGNDDQLRQVFLNLMLNAADAIRSGTSAEDGKIAIRTSNTEGEEGASTPMLKVRFTDNGDGIDPETLQNIFDPFYTTKEPGKGTGLGLSVSYMIIEGMGGAIRAESGPGQGASFSILLPIARGDLISGN